MDFMAFLYGKLPQPESCPRWDLIITFYLKKPLHEQRLEEKKIRNLAPYTVNRYFFHIWIQS